jgi:hypothetical protein
VLCRERARAGSPASALIPRWSWPLSGVGSVAAHEAAPTRRDQPMLTDTQLVLLASAPQRDGGLLTPSERLNGQRARSAPPGSLPATSSERSRSHRTSQPGGRTPKAVGSVSRSPRPACVRSASNPSPPAMRPRPRAITALPRRAPVRSPQQMRPSLAQGRAPERSRRSSSTCSPGRRAPASRTLRMRPGGCPTPLVQPSLACAGVGTRSSAARRRAGPASTACIGLIRSTPRR